MVKSMEAQAAERGIPVPVGKTAGQLRDLGWDVSCDVPDSAELSDKPATGSTLELDAPTNHSWMTRVSDKVYHLALLDGIIDEAFAADPELAARKHVFDEQREELIEMLTEAAEKARTEKLPTVGRYYDVLATFVISLRR